MASWSARRIVPSPPSATMNAQPSSTSRGSAVVPRSSVSRSCWRAQASIWCSCGAQSPDGFARTPTWVWSSTSGRIDRACCQPALSTRRRQLDREREPGEADQHAQHPASERRTITGPSRAPARSPTASGGIAAQSTGPSSAKPTAAVALAIPSTAFLSAFARASVSCAARGRARGAARRPPRRSSRRRCRRGRPAGDAGARPSAARRAGVGARAHEDRQRRAADQQRRDPLERLRLRDEQQRGARGAAGDRGGAQPRDLAPLARAAPAASPPRSRCC